MKLVSISKLGGALAASSALLPACLAGGVRRGVGDEGMAGSGPEALDRRLRGLLRGYPGSEERLVSALHKRLGAEAAAHGKGGEG